jgi:hypothetical protein
MWRNRHTYMRAYARRYVTYEKGGEVLVRRSDLRLHPPAASRESNLRSD